ncbi:acetoin utilization protein AcuC [Geobacter sp. SVR]|uniref:acetoin utilization protein AcuC n=1 Tax=Geobacter sp. SVR TaxID=2495594 RepID=UPI00143F001E|nr:acetoin utilization protein AcuC [Geobacter sp. SVR]BCS52091.1 acetoin utilization protein AcuC [Geobacter sp. SVR]GCF86546.1 acetoin utilization protein AcuC [Geobacter sp. SVR]
MPVPRTALIYSPLFGSYSYGDDHPFKLQRYHLARDLMDAYGLLDLPEMEIRDCRPVDEQLVLSFHDAAYIDRLKEFSLSDEPRADFLFGLGDADCPVFKGLYECAALGAGATWEAARLVEEEGFEVAFNLAGGWHHAHRSRASGFSYLNDAVLAINWLVARGRRVVYLDIDAHHGDGVQEGFYDSDQVLTISLHESGIYFFPGTGFEEETGEGRGCGYTVNLPLIAHTDDAIYMKAFDEIVYPLIAAYDPDVIVTQIGADTFRTDPLTRLEITTHSYGYIMRKLKALKIPWVALGGGGYDLMNTARAWSIAWAVMNGVELDPRLPDSFVRKVKPLGYPHRALLDAMHWSEEQERNIALEAAEKSIARIKELIFPVIIGRYSPA